MPIYEYHCRECGKDFEIFVRSAQQKLTCSCGSSDLEKKFSVFAVSEAPGSSQASGCMNGSCGLQSPGCHSGMCGLN